MNQRGQGVAEYALIFVLVVIVGVIVLFTLGGQIEVRLSEVGSSIEHPGFSPAPSISVPLLTPTP